jgi:hypothetical protein
MISIARSVSADLAHAAGPFLAPFGTCLIQLKPARPTSTFGEPRFLRFERPPSRDETGSGKDFRGIIRPMSIDAPAEGHRGGVPAWDVLRSDRPRAEEDRSVPGLDVGPTVATRVRIHCQEHTGPLSHR